MAVIEHDTDELRRRQPATKHPLLLRFALFLNDAKHYKRVKNHLRAYLTDSGSRKKSYFDIYVVALALFSISLLMYGVKNQTTSIIWSIEIAITIFFAVEYILRLWVHGDLHTIVLRHIQDANFFGTTVSFKKLAGEMVQKKLEYVGSFYGVIDLLAILPIYQPLRIFRVFLIFRLFKFFRIYESLHEFLDAFKSRRFELWFLFFMVVFVLFFFGITFYVIEGGGQNSNLNSFIDAFYFAAISSFTVGYGDIVPKSEETKLISILMVLSGIAIISMFTSVVVSALHEKLDDIKTNRQLFKAGMLKNHTIICGYGRMGQTVAKELEGIREIIVVDSKSEAVKLALSRKIEAISADATKSELLKKIGVESAREVLALTNSDAINLAIVLSARKQNKTARIISRCNLAQSEEKLLHAGASQVLYPYRLAASMAYGFEKEPFVFDAFYGFFGDGKDGTFESFKVASGSNFEGKSVEEFSFERFKIVLFGVFSKRVIEGYKSIKIGDGYFYFNPNNFILDADDEMLFFGSRSVLTHQTLAKAIFYKA